VLGVAYKKNVRDFRESPAKETIAGLEQHGAIVTYSDPHVPSLRDEGIELDSVPLDEKTLAAADCVLILADHDAFDHQLIARSAKLIVDTRNAMGRRGLRGDNVVTT
jgi:UDP-N-acetyl-D-glucosamine dehydrogenase